MRDPNQGRPVLRTQFLHFKNDLRLDGDIQRSGGLVGDQQSGSVKQGDGDGYALAHTA